MGRARQFPFEKLIIPVLASDALRLERVKPLLERRFGPVDYESPRIQFDFTDYYTPEMGPGLIRCILGFERLVSPENLARIKRRTNRIEDSLAEEGGRRVNLDPGLLDLNRLLLATTKHAGHRIPLSKGIYAEITLHYRRGGWQAFDWTYPDYRSEAYHRILSELRSIYKRQLKR